MRRESQIRHKLKQVIFRHRKKFVEKGLSRRPENCEHNRVVTLPVHTGNRATLRVCGFNDNNVVCDPTMAGEAQARECPYFGGCNTPESLKSEFSKKLGLGEDVIQAGALAKDYPDLIALMWVLGTAGKSNGKKPEEPQSNILAFFGSDDVDLDDVSDDPLLDEESDE